MDTPPTAPADGALPDPLALLEALPAGVGYAVEERIAWANPKMMAMLGVPFEQVRGRGLFDLVSPEDRAVVEERYWARQRGDPALPDAYEIEVLRPDGERRRLQLEPRFLGERRVVLLVRDLNGRARERGLLAALSEVALAVQRVRSEPEILRVAGAGIVALGMGFAAIRLRGARAALAHACHGGDAVEAVERVVGRPLSSLGAELEAGESLSRALAEGRGRFSDALVPVLVRLFAHLAPGVDRPALEAELVRAGLRKGVLCPLWVGGRVWGILGVASDTLGSEDAAALGLFASQVAAALENAEAIGELEKRNRELAGIRAVAAAGSETGLDRLAPLLLRAAMEGSASDAAGIYQLEPEGEALVLLATEGLGGVFARAFPRLPVADTFSGKVARELEPRAFAVAALPPDASGPLGAEGVRQLAIVPLHIKGRLAGLLYLGRREERAFAGDELRACEDLARQVAIQLESSRLQTDLQRQVRLVSVLFDLSRLGAEALEVAPLVERTADEITRAVRAEAVAIHLCREDRLDLAAARRRCEGGWEPVAELSPEAEALCRRALASRRTEVESLAPGPKASAGRPVLRRAVAVPLIAKERLIGTLSAVAGEEGFAVEEIRLLESGATLVAMAIAHVRLFERERERLEGFKLLLEVGRVVTASLDLPSILEAAAGSMALMSEATHCFIWLVEPGERVLRGAALSVSEDAEHFRSIRWPLDEPSAAALAVRRRVPVRIARADRSPLVQRELVDRHRLVSLLAVPLMVRDTPIGAVVLGDRADREFTDVQVERATVACSQVAIAVANARLYEDLKRSYQELGRAQEQLVARERLAALGELAAVVAHEVRNPLGVVFNSLGSLRRMLKPQGDAAMLLDIVGEEADRLNRIVGDLLDFARPHELAMSPEPLGSLVAAAVESVRTMGEANGVGLETRVQSDLPQVPVDARLLRQVILNLVINAVQAMPHGGSVVVSVARERRAVRIEVADTGPGVSPDLAGRIFQPFFTTKATGTGLGLAVVRRIVEAHRGEVEMESAPGAGARFTVRLPLDGGR